MPILAIVVLVLGTLAGACNRAPQPATQHELSSSPTTAATSTGASGNSAAATDAGSPRSGFESRDASRADAPQPAPAFEEVTVPEGTVLRLILDTPVASDSSAVEGPVRAHLSKPVTVNGVAVLPAGSGVDGVVTNVVRSGKVKGRAQIAMRFDSVTRSGDDVAYRIETSSVGRTAPATKKDDTLKVVAPAAGGAIIGRIAGGRKGAAIGTAVGAGAGGAVVLSTRGEEVRLPKGASVSVRLTAPLTVRVPR